MIKVYVAGAMQSDNILGVLTNIRQGTSMGARLLKAGYAPFVPHLDIHFALAEDGTAPIEYYYNYTMEWLRVSDVVLVLPNSEHSKGVKAEIEEAKRLGIPVVYSVQELHKLDERLVG